LGDQPDGSLDTKQNLVHTKSTIAPTRSFVLPSPGLVIIANITGNVYTISSQIGEGNFGHVFECKDTWDNALAAKVFKPRGQDYDVVKANATREFHTLTHLRHPFITYVYDAFEFQDTFYIITERCFGPFADYVEQNWFDGSLWIQPIARCLLQAVQYMHTAGVVHKDIHMGNVFANTLKNEMGSPTNKFGWNFKLGDMGISSPIAEMQATKSMFAPWMIPPEALDPDRFGPLDHRVDLYHCGLLFLQILRGKKIAFTPEQIMAGLPREMALELPMPYKLALEKALRRRVSFRTASASELWRDLKSPINDPDL